MNNASLELNLMALLPTASMVVFALLVMAVDVFARGGAHSRCARLHAVGGAGWVCLSPPASASGCSASR
jgi:hypothetical protein